MPTDSRPGKAIGPDKHLDIGYERIAVRCPDLIRQLEAGAWSAWLPREWTTPSNDLSAASLIDLRQLVAHELATRAPARAPGLVALTSILLDLGPMESRRTGLWARFTNGCGSLGASGSFGWRRLVGPDGRPGQCFADRHRLIGYGCLAAVVSSL